MKKTHTWAKAKTILLMVALAALLLFAAGGALASRSGATEDTVAIQVYYKLDPRLTGGVHIGERWVSPPLYDIVGRRSTYTIDARVEGVTATGERNVVAADWVVTGPNLVAVSPTHDNMVALRVRSQGETQLEVTAEGMNKTLYISSAFQDSECNNLRVMVSQTSQPSAPTQECRVLLPLIISR